MNRRGLLAAAALVVVANAIALVGVARNRASALRTIDLTERELALGYQGEENSGIDLRLTINYQSTMDWFDDAKLQELGFPASVSSIKEYRDWPARPAYVAFEYDESIERQSRLVPVGASREPVAANSPLKYLIVRATVQPGVVIQDGKTVVRGRIVEILDSQIHVPLPAALALEKPGPAQPRLSERPRYTIRLAYGTRFEPWVISVTALPK